MDEVDIAQQFIETHLEESLQRRKHQYYISSKNCQECEIEISEDRRNALPGVALCIHCQERLERS